MQYLKQNASITIKLGPFLDDSDGKTAETGLSITQADVRLSKNGGSFAQKNDSSSLTHDENGWYSCPLNATDTNTLGRLVVAVHKSGALPVWREFMVVSANVYDSLVGASDKLQVDVDELNGSTTSLDNLQSMVNTALGADNKVLISTDDQDLSTTLHVDAKAISGSTTAADNVETNIPNLDKSITALNDVSVDDIMAGVVEGSYTLQSTLRLMFAVLCGKSSGGGTATLKFKDSSGTKDRVTATVDTNGNRLTTTLDAS